MDNHARSLKYHVGLVIPAAIRGEPGRPSGSDCSAMPLARVTPMMDDAQTVAHSLRQGAPGGVSASTAGRPGAGSPASIVNEVGPVPTYL